jgi:hypothetical protein
MNRIQFPFTAIVGQERMRRALVLNISPPEPVTPFIEDDGNESDPWKGFQTGFC